MLWFNRDSSLSKLIKDSTVYTELSNGELVPHKLDLKTVLKNKPEYVDILAKALIGCIPKFRVSNNLCCLYPSVAATILVSAATTGVIKGTLLVKEGFDYFRVIGFGAGKEIKEATLFDDVSYSGDTLLKMLKTAEEQGILIKDALTIIDRCRGASRRLREHGVTLQSFVSVDF